MNELGGNLGDTLLVIPYESFASETERTINELKHFLGLHKAIPIPEVKLASLNKWKTQLSDVEITDIQNIVGFFS